MAWGITVPLDGIPLADHPALYREIADLGYTDLWSTESNGADGFTPLSLAAGVEPRLRLGTAIVSSFTRGPALLAQSAAALATAAPGRFVLGLGAWIETRGWHDDVGADGLARLAEPAINFACGMLSVQHANVHKRGRHFKSLAVEERHRRERNACLRGARGEGRPEARKLPGARCRRRRP